MVLELEHETAKGSVYPRWILPPSPVLVMVEGDDVVGLAFGEVGAKIKACTVRRHPWVQAGNTGERLAGDGLSAQRRARCKDDDESKFRAVECAAGSADKRSRLLRELGDYICSIPSGEHHARARLSTRCELTIRTDCSLQFTITITNTNTRLP